MQAMLYMPDGRGKLLGRVSIAHHAMETLWLAGGGACAAKRAIGAPMR